ncbi:substrate-binding domain-containing protein [Gilvimarinus sp. SDUM040013]|uniref:Substrate-binding domain-containing protein n=1 Tax=Gilvimarinus gilvus TaxID=3058038 RepID=A0ABU4RZR6_9GAMM|nr:substrate-binding domain-containing protein [Gilvimarinus sp. SDUM040013]MDO3386249.1 substrate-binding domain-containing protein [Gilvimarinus sp. SDUM040013]MDX6849756.1 substrate-binding domain-containing protein [Gilvimarinus sp. SDUM040013]
MPQSVDDIAQSLDLSVTTIRLVLLGKARKYRISRATEARVRTYIDEHGYQINHAARSLRLKRSDTLALIVPRLSNHYFAYLAELMESRCQQAGLQLMVSCCYDNEENQLKLIDNFQQRNVDGLFLVPSNAKLATTAAKLFNDRLVLLDRDFSLPNFSVVISDNESAGEQMTRYCLDFCKRNGREQSVLFIAGNPFMPSIDARLQGVKRAAKEAGLNRKQFVVRTAPRNGFGEGVDAINAYLQDHNSLPSVLMTSSIPVFEGALSALRESPLGYSSSQVLATFDDNTMLDFLPNPVVSLRQDYDSMIDHAFAEMQFLLRGQTKPLRHVSPLTLIARNMAN